MRKTLSEIPSVGKVALCGSCDRIHLMMGNLTLELTQEEFVGLDKMIHRAAQTFVEPAPGMESQTRQDLSLEKPARLH